MFRGRLMKAGRTGGRKSMTSGRSKVREAIRYGVIGAGVGVLVCAALMGLRAWAADDLALIPASARKAAPDFTLTDVEGKPLTLSQYRGKVVLLDFWAVDCGGCKVEIPWYVAFDQKYHSQGLQLLGVDMYGESPEVIRPFMAKSGMTYPVA